jgi:hypothetical protein
VSHQIEIREWWENAQWICVSFVIWLLICSHRNLLYIWINQDILNLLFFLRSFAQRRCCEKSWADMIQPRRAVVSCAGCTHSIFAFYFWKFKVCAQFAPWEKTVSAPVRNAWTKCIEEVLTPLLMSRGLRVDWNHSGMRVSFSFGGFLKDTK